MRESVSDISGFREGIPLNKMAGFASERLIRQLEETVTCEFMEHVNNLAQHFCIGQVRVHVRITNKLSCSDNCHWSLKN